MVSGYGFGNLGLYGNLTTYGTLTLTESSPPQSWTEPLSVAEMITYLRLPSLTQPQTDEMGGFITAAREQAEILQNRDLVRKQWDLVADYWTSYTVELRSPLVSVDLVQYRDSTGAITALNETDNYLVDKNKQPGIITPLFNTTWPNFAPSPSSAILIRFTSGYLSTSAYWNDAGARVKIGMRLLVSDWWNNRYSVQVSQDADGIPRWLRALLSQGCLARAR